MSFTAKDVAKLREITGAGMMDCKKALAATNGDMDKAVEYLREHGISIAAKKANRIASEGVVSAYVSEDGLVGSLIELNCESDFVARGEEFQSLAKNIAEHVAKKDSKDVESCLDEKFVLDESMTIRDLITAATAKIGEKISLRRIARQSIAMGREESYIHMGGKIGVMLELQTDKQINDEEFISLCHDIAMHIAAFSPKYVYNEEVPAEEIEHEKSILKAQIQNDPKTASKPEQVIEKMIVGRLDKFYKEVCLIDQEFAKDSSKTIRNIVDEYAKKSGASIKITRFTRFVMGEGLEKKNENFAEEIAKLTN